MFTKTKALAAATIAALGLATVTATPAQADNGDIARFLAGAAALAIIVDATSNNHRRVVERQYVYVPAPHRHRERVVIVRPGRDHGRFERRIDRRVDRRVARPARHRNATRVETRRVVTTTTTTRTAPRRDHRRSDVRANVYFLPGNAPSSH